MATTNRIFLIDQACQPYLLKLPKFSPGEKFYQFHHLLSVVKFLSMDFLSCVNDYVQDMATFTTFGEILFHQIFLQYSGTWAWQNFCPMKIFGYMVPSMEIRIMVLRKMMKLTNGREEGGRVKANKEWKVCQRLRHQ